MVMDYVEYMERMREAKDTDEPVCQCETCGKSLFLGDDVVQIEDVWLVHFCNMECAYKYTNIHVVDFEAQGYCSLCGEPLEGDEYEVYRDIEGDLFCTLECAEIRSGIKWTELDTDETEIW